MKNKVPPPRSQFVQNKKDGHNFGTRARAARNKAKGKLRARTTCWNKSGSFRMNLFSSLMLKEAAPFRNLCRQNSCTPIRRRRKNSAKKGENKGKYNLVDRISALPDHILHSIMSLLPLKDAMATSILSRRWQYVWTSAVNLDFDAGFEVAENKWRFHSMKPELQDLKTQRYVDWVNAAVVQHRGPAVERFRACFAIDERFPSSVDEWVQFAMNKRVQILELLFYVKFGVSPANVKLLGLKNDSTLNLSPMPPETPSLRSCGYSTGFRVLKVLHFRYVDVSGEVLEYFLSNCPVLERLTVFASQKSLVNLRVVGSSVALKYLDIRYCCALKSIEIGDANLVSFIYDGFAIDLVIRNVPLLVEVSISVILANSFENDGEIYFRSIELPFTQLSCCLSQLTVLMLNIEGVMYNPNHGFPILSNLEHLELIVDAENPGALCHLTSFMKASPYLQRLVLKYGISSWPIEIKRRQERVDRCPHPNLRVVEVVGYRACSAFEHVMYLLDNAVALERMVIDPIRRWNFPSALYPRDMDRGAEEVQEEKKGRDHAMQHLKEKVAPQESANADRSASPQKADRRSMILKLRGSSGSEEYDSEIETEMKRQVAKKHQKRGSRRSEQMRGSSGSEEYDSEIETEMKRQVAKKHQKRSRKSEQMRGSSSSEEYDSEIETEMKRQVAKKHQRRSEQMSGSEEYDSEIEAEMKRQVAKKHQRRSEQMSGSEEYDSEIEAEMKRQVAKKHQKRRSKDADNSESASSAARDKDDVGKKHKVA